MSTKIIDYANLPRSEWPEIISRSDAKDGGLKLYFTGAVCKYGHVAEKGFNDGCKVCMYNYVRTPEYKAKRDKRHNTAEYKAAAKAYRDVHHKTQKYKKRESDRHKAYRQDPAFISKAKGRHDKWVKSGKEHIYNQTKKRKASIKSFTESKKGTLASIKRVLKDKGFVEGLTHEIPNEYIDAIHSQRVLKRAIKKLKQTT